MVPDAGGKTGEISRAERGGFGDGRTNDGNAENIGLELHESVVGGGAAIDAEFGERRVGVGVDGIGEIGNLIGDALEGSAGEMRGGGAASESEDGAAGGGIPVRGSESDEGGNEVDAAVIGDGVGEGLDFR